MRLHVTLGRDLKNISVCPLLARLVILYIYIRVYIFVSVMVSRDRFIFDATDTSCVHVTYKALDLATQYKSSYESV